MAQIDERPQRMDLPSAVTSAVREDEMALGASQPGEHKEIGATP
jgi:hypothetical protein